MLIETVHLVANPVLLRNGMRFRLIVDSISNLTASTLVIAVAQSIRYNLASNSILSHNSTLQLMEIILFLTKMLVMDLDTTTSTGLSNSKLDTNAQTVLVKSFFGDRADCLPRSDFKHLSVLRTSKLINFQTRCDPGVLVWFRRDSVRCALTQAKGSCCIRASHSDCDIGPTVDS